MELSFSIIRSVASEVNQYDEEMHSCVDFYGKDFARIEKVDVEEEKS